MLIANPLYDAIFKYMLEDMEVAKTFLSAIIEEPIEEVEFSATERVVKKEQTGTKDEAELPPPILPLGTSLTVLRLDFCAKVKTDAGYKTVLIELQKAKVLSDVSRFRKYLGRQYAKDDPRNAQIYAIYFLNYDFGRPDHPVIVVDPKARDRFTKEEDEVDGFIASLTHKSWFVQVRQLKAKRRGELERLLALFDQDEKEQYEHALNIDPAEIPDKYLPIVRRLHKACVDAEMEEAMNIEDDFLRALADQERRAGVALEENQKVRQELADAQKALDAKDAALEANKAILEANKAALEAKDAALEARAREIAELRKLMAQNQKPAK